VKLPRDDISSPEFWTDERCFITECLNSEEIEEFSLAIARVRPAVTTQLHCLRDTKEIYIIRKGTGLVLVGQQEFEISVGDSVIIPANTPQRITNLSNSEDLEFYCHCSPRFVPEAYENLEANNS
jgi:mannose-6-phosphate isomerase-like protein (cupin superfamily)|tara:strand:+ start:948 stop:1322 length:375 start_codon:yes stop_codon:yes gene_type:complete